MATYEVAKMKRSPNVYSKNLFIVLTKQEAYALIQSLGGQLANNSPNQGRIDLPLRDQDVKIGDLGIFVRDEPICFGCQAGVEPWSGKTVKGVLLCATCHKDVCEYCQTFRGHSVHCHLYARPTKRPKRKKR